MTDDKSDVMSPGQAMVILTSQEDQVGDLDLSIIVDRAARSYLATVASNGEDKDTHENRGDPSVSLAGGGSPTRRAVRIIPQAGLVHDVVGLLDEHLLVHPGSIVAVS